MNKSDSEIIINEIRNSKFFIGKSGKKVNHELFQSVKLRNIDFNVRFVTVLQSFLNILQSKDYLKNLGNLLNTDYNYFLNLKNCGNSTIKSAREKILLFFNDAKKIEPSLPIIKNTQISPNPTILKLLIYRSMFFIGNIGERVENEFFRKIELRFIAFEIRFKNIIQTQEDLNNLEDLLNTDFNDLLEIKNCGIFSINSARERILL
ncbi:hypothetical protein ACFLSV_08470, partial [Bacteroidota bacterium]